MAKNESVVREGLITGALGAAAVALWFLVIDLMHGRVLFTPAALGSAIFKGATGIEQVQRTAGTILGYSLLHIVAFMAVGLVAALLMTSADREPRLLLGVGVAFMVLEAASLGILTLAATWLLDALSMWTVVIANAVAALVMGFYLYRAHPQARANLRTNLEERDLDPAG